MKLQSREYQTEAENNIYKSWATGHSNTLCVLPTGAGKTFIFSKIIADHKGAACAIAHRQELVGQISIALAKNGIYHKIIGPVKVVKFVVGLHMTELGHSFYDPNSNKAVAGVDTLIRRTDSWFNKVTLWVQDEAHHVLKGNKWGLAASMFPNAKGLGVTATPIRADGKGLGRHADGLFDNMVIGPTMRELINLKFLTDYRIFAPPSDLDLSQVAISATTGDYNKDKLRKAVKKSHITGDIVQHYKRIANGKLGITFVPDVEIATITAQQYNEAGVPAAVISAKTPDKLRVELLNKFKRGELKQLVNVDLFGEGFDLPAVTVVSFGRPTQSFSLYVQQFGRALRILEGKKGAIIIDHVGNVIRHGLPDAARNWTLDRRERRRSNQDPDVIPVKACPECTAVYERVFKDCPFCGFYAEPSSRSAPKFVDGDLFEMDAALLAQLRGDIDKINMDKEAYRLDLIRRRVPVIGQMAHVKRHVVRQEKQQWLKDAIAWWAGYQRKAGYEDSQSYRKFYFKFGTDVLTAQTLGSKEAVRLTEKIWEDLIV